MRRAKSAVWMATFLGLIASAAALPGCVFGGDAKSGDGTEADREQRIGPGRITPAEIQSELMSFSDTYSNLLNQAISSSLIADLTPDRRMVAVNLRTDSIQSAITIAAGANPVSSMLDMTVMITLTRMVWEEFWIPEYWGEVGAPVTAALLQAENEIWQIAAKALGPDEQKALRSLISEMRERYADQVIVSNLRASEFADDRGRSFVKVEGGGSLLSLFALDPLANLPPTTREIAKSRILAERAFFFMKRMPQIIRWQTESLIVNTAITPEVRTVVAGFEASGRGFEKAGDGFQRTADAAENLVEIIPEQRETLVSDFFEGVAAERQAILDSLANLDEEQAQLSATLAEMRTTVEATNQLSESLRPTLAAATELSEVLVKLKTPREGSRIFDIREYIEITRSATETVQEFNAALDSVNVLLDSSEWDETAPGLERLFGEGRAGVESLIDRLFVRGLTIVIVFLVGLLIVQIIARRIPSRVVTAPAS